MKRSLSIFLMGALMHIQLLALTVTPDIPNLPCGMTTVTLTFDCLFTGTVFVTSTPPSGITFSNIPGTPPIWNVTSGEITFDIDVALPEMTGGFNIDFQVLGSNMGCAVATTNVSAIFTYNCITPTNDFCVDAFPLNVSNNTCTLLNFSTLNSSDSGTGPSCDTTPYFDLWYSFYANSTSVTLEHFGFPGTLGFYGLYDDCPNTGGTELACNMMFNTPSDPMDPANPLNPGSEIITGLVVNTKYYLRITFNSGLNVKNQSICLQSNAPIDPCLYNIAVSDIGPFLPSSTYIVSDIIETGGISTVTSAGATYNAGTCVELNPGFSCTTNFEVIMTGCTP